MVKKDDLDDFLNWVDSPSVSKPRLAEAVSDTPASQLDETPEGEEDEIDGYLRAEAEAKAMRARGESLRPIAPPRADERPAPTFVMPDRKEPVIQTPQVKVPEDIEAPIPMSPGLADHILEQLSQSEWQEMFNGTIKQVTPEMTAEEVQARIHANTRRIELLKVQNAALRVTYDGKLALVDAPRLKALKERDSHFYATRGKSGAVAEKARSAKTPKKDDGLSTIERQVKSLVRAHLPEALIRKVFTESNTAIPENLSALIMRFKIEK